MRICWCGNTELSPFGNEFGECHSCGTLVYLRNLHPERLLVYDDENDFYGKKYWLEHQQKEFGYDSIHARARNDISERNLHWLRALLKYYLPPAKVLELGCSHGSFVALLRQAGYDASGVEMSPWVVEFGRKIFDVPISVGPVETLEIPSGSLDVIVLMDVLEHFTDPVATMAHCLQLLKPEGLLLIQTPKFIEGMTYTALVESNGSFLKQLKAEEHLYLFSERSVTSLFQQIGAEHIQFETAIFGHYDMFFAVSQVTLKTNTPEQIDAALLEIPNGRIALALLDLQHREQNFIHRLQVSETDCAARGKQISTLTEILKESEADRAARGEQIETLTKMLKESEDDRAARWTQIETLTKMLKESEAERVNRTEQIESILALLRVLFARRGFRWLNKFISYSEVKKLEKFMGIPNE